MCNKGLSFSKHTCHTFRGTSLNSFRDLIVFYWSLKDPQEMCFTFQVTSLNTLRDSNTFDWSLKDLPETCYMFPVVSLNTRVIQFEELH